MIIPMPNDSEGDSPIQPQAVYELIRRTRDANTALLRGDVETYLKLIELADDFTLMQPFGGPVNRGFDPSPEHRAELSAFFDAGPCQVELVQARASGDLVVLVLIERQVGRVGDVPDQEWALRVTLVFARDQERWQLVHRHADPLVERIAVAQAAALARGAAGRQADATRAAMAA
jgi:ketosteroid isomerase-like protein